MDEFWTATGANVLGALLVFAITTPILLAVDSRMAKKPTSGSGQQNQFNVKDVVGDVAIKVKNVDKSQKSIINTTINNPPPVSRTPPEGSKESSDQDVWLYVILALVGSVLAIITFALYASLLIFVSVLALSFILGTVAAVIIQGRRFQIGWPNPNRSLLVHAVVTVGVAMLAWIGILVTVRNGFSLSTLREDLLRLDSLSAMISHLISGYEPAELTFILSLLIGVFATCGLIVWLGSFSFNSWQWLRAERGQLSDEALSRATSWFRRSAGSRTLEMVSFIVLAGIAALFALGLGYDLIGALGDWNADNVERALTPDGT